ncbi:MAG: dienelactone hydrolase family protein [Pseudomonadota bacterium]
MKAWLVGWLIWVGLGAAQAAVVTKETSYEADGQRYVAYIAYDDAIKGKRPGVLVVHEWWGHTPYVRKRAEMLAKMGYVGMALDMYGEGKTADHPTDAGAFAKAANADFPKARKRFEAARELLVRQPQTDGEHIAAIGYCFGGSVVLNMARVGVDLDAVASFHGALASPHFAEPGAVKARVFVANGAADPMVTTEDVLKFQEEMREAKVEYTYIEYPGVKHSFTNPDADRFAKEFNMPLGYDAHADSHSWAMLKAFLEQAFK